MAVAWGVFLILNLGWPRAEVYGDSPIRRFSAPLFTAAMLTIGGLYYLLVRRHKTGVLEAHRAPATAPGAMLLDRDGGERG
jgi:hypothetical protein